MTRLILSIEIIIIFGVIILLGYFSLKSVNRVDLVNNKSSNTTIVVVYDNNEYDKNLETGFGFSCLVKLKDENILFDTGGDSPTLLNNMKKLEIEPKNIDIIVLSHIHGDHTNGLSGFLEVNSNVTVYIPQSFPNSFRNEIKSYGSNFIDVSNSIKIYNGIYSTGELGTWIKEQSLIIKTEKGLIIITGCAHSGIVYIVKKSKELANETVYLVTGGFHLSGASDSEIRNIIKDFRNMEVKKVAPCHCTGNRAIELFKEEYKDDFIRNGVGKIIEV